MSAVPSPRPRPLRLAAFLTENAPADAPPGSRSQRPGNRADFDELERQVQLARTLERGTFDAVFLADGTGHLAGAIAYATRHIGIAFTASVVHEDPASFARRVSSLDHASQGRVAWNVADDPLGAWTEEYADVTYKLWEGSWEEDALSAGGRSGRHSVDGKVHRINHRGPRYQVTGPHLVSPSPQRTPVLFRACASEADRAFAAVNAEAVFLQSPSPAAAARDAADLRSRAASHGRLPGDIKFFAGLRVVTARTEAEAGRKAAGLDTAAGGQIVGTPEQVADELAIWRDAGADGINLLPAGRPASYEEFVDQVVPVLRQRGLTQPAYAGGSLRHKLFGRGDRLPDRHPAGRYRGAFAGPEDAAARLENSVSP